MDDNIMINFIDESGVKKVPPHFIKPKGYNELLEETKKLGYRVTGTLLTLVLMEDKSETK